MRTKQSDSGIHPDSVELLRARISTVLFSILTVASLVQLLPSVFLALSNDSPFRRAVAIIEIFFSALLLAVALGRSRTNRFRRPVIVSGVFCTGAILSLAFGPAGAGALFLLATPAFAALLYGRRAAIVFVFLDILLFGILSVVLVSGLSPWETDLRGWLFISVNSVVLGGAVAIPHALLLEAYSKESVARRVALSGLELAERRLDYLESFDELTALANGTSLKRRIQEEISRSSQRDRTFAVIAVGFDRFKRINAAYGNAVGDAFLFAVARKLEGLFRPGDMLGRLRGDIFAALLSDLNQVDDVVALAERTRDVLSAPVAVEGHALTLSASVGVAIYPGDGEDPDTLISAAEAALRHAKESNRGGWRLFDSAAESRAKEHLAAEEELLKGIRGSCISAAFQPIYDAERRLMGAEVLARWTSDEGRTWRPDEFIPLAERLGVIDRIGETIFARACEALRAWREAGKEAVSLSVNVSALQLNDDRFLPFVIRAAAAAEVDPSFICLEITESAFLSGQDEESARLRELRRMGFKVAIDDFGTGYSSFSKLREYPVDLLKIDRSFVMPLPDDPRAAAVVRGIIDLSHVMGFRVVAEGVETEGQLAALKAVGCDFFQGYLLSRPLPESDLALLLAPGRPAG